MNKQDLARALCSLAAPIPYNVLQSRCMHEIWDIPCNRSYETMRKYAHNLGYTEKDAEWKRLEKTRRLSELRHQDKTQH